MAVAKRPKRRSYKQELAYQGRIMRKHKVPKKFRDELRAIHMRSKKKNAKAARARFTRFWKSGPGKKSKKHTLILKSYSMAGKRKRKAPVKRRRKRKVGKRKRKVGKRKRKVGKRKRKRKRKVKVRRVKKIVYIGGKGYIFPNEAAAKRHVRKMKSVSYPRKWNVDKRYPKKGKRPKRLARVYGGKARLSTGDAIAYRVRKRHKKGNKGRPSRYYYL